MFQGRVLEVEVDLIKLDLMERLKNLFEFEILLEEFFEMILILIEIYYGKDDEINEDENESDDDLNLNNVDDGINFLMDYISYYTFYRMNDGKKNDGEYVIFISISFSISSISYSFSLSLCHGSYVYFPLKKNIGKLFVKNK